MICIRCQHDSKYPERKDTKSCPNCGGKFAFEPRENDPFTDMAFQKAIDKVSAGGQVKWGVENLYYELCRKPRNSGAMVALFVFVLVIGILMAVVVAQAQPAALIAYVPAVLLVLRAIVKNVKAGLIPRGDFERMWDRWGSVHGKPKGVIARKPQDDKPARAPDPDIGDYSFDRAVICDRARTVDLLLANNFHFENNCAVLSVGGYPRQAFETVRRMLRRNPRLEVFVLHDITPEGCRLAHRLAKDPEWFKGLGIRIVDVGLRPVHATPFQNLFEKSQQEVPSGGGITPVEARWLSRHRLELAVIRPEQIVKRLFRAMSQSQQAARTATPVLGGRGASGHAAGSAAAAAAGAAVLLPAAAMAGRQDAEELARQKKKQAADQSSNSGGGDGGGGESSWEVDTDSFSSDADASDGGADSFG